MKWQPEPASLRRRAISPERLVHDLRALGVLAGDHVAVALSFRSIGYVDGGPEAFIDALLDAVGPAGTLMMNTYTEFFSRTEVELGWVDYLFDADSTRVNTGAVPEVFRQRKDAVRSRHPTNSVAALGKYADYLTRGHDEHASAYLPYARLSEVGGKYLAVGIGNRLVGFRHQAQYAAGLLHIVPWVRFVRFRRGDGRTETFALRDRGGCTRRLPELVVDLRDQGVVQEGTLGQASAILVPARQSLQIMTAVLRSHPERNLCDSVLCYWCRELERRLNLFQAVRVPRYFQTHTVVVRLLMFMNQIRETEGRIVAWTKRLIKRYVLRRRPQIRSS